MKGKKRVIVRKGYLVSVGPRTRANGRTENDTAWAWKPVDAGFTVANGLRDSRVDTVSDNRPRPRRGTRARGRAAFRMDTVRRPTRTVVSFIFHTPFFFYVVNKNIPKEIFHKSSTNFKIFFQFPSKNLKLKIKNKEDVF